MCIFYLGDPTLGVCTCLSVCGRTYCTLCYTCWWYTRHHRHKSRRHSFLKEETKKALMQLPHRVDQAGRYLLLIVVWRKLFRITRSLWTIEDKQYIYMQILKTTNTESNKFRFIWFINISYKIFISYEILERKSLFCEWGKKIVWMCNTNWKNSTDVYYHSWKLWLRIIVENKIPLIDLTESLLLGEEYISVVKL